MNIVHLRRNDEMVDRILTAALPGYRGASIRATVSPTVSFHGTQWDEGNRTVYAIVRLADMKVAPVQEAPFFGFSPLHANTFTIPQGFVVVAHVQFGTREYANIITPDANLTPALNAPNTLTEDETTVLVATRSRKSTYQGMSNYRFHEVRRCRGITLDRYNAAKASLITKKLLNKAGAITVEGRNAAGSGDL